MGRWVGAASFSFSEKSYTLALIPHHESESESESIYNGVWIHEYSCWFLFICVSHSLGPNYQCRIWAISTAKNLKSWMYRLLMKSPTFSQLGVQILHLGEIYQQEFGNGRRRLFYDSKRWVLVFQRDSVLVHSWFLVSHRSDRVIGCCGRLDYNCISGFSWQFRHVQLDAICMKLPHSSGCKKVE